jgi:hypothetical protein
MSLLFISKIPATLRNAFTTRLQQIAAELGAKPDWLMQVMWSESRLNPAAVNPISKATGLIQFMPATAKSLGTSVDALKSMTAVQQLEFVRKYFLPYKGKMKSYYDVYAVVFFPALIGKPDTWVLQTARLSPGVIAKQNPVVNVNKDDKITVAEFKEYVYNSVVAANRSVIFSAAAGLGIVAAVLVFFYSLMTEYVVQNL